MKRPIAELVTVCLQADAQAAHTRVEHELWQILRRKQGYVTHRVYEQEDDPLRRLVYSEWESKKALDGALQQVQTTPLTRQARAACSAAPQRTVVELVGPVTSTKGLHLPEGATAVTALCRLTEDAAGWQEQAALLWRSLSQEPGHVAHVLFRGFEDPGLVGSLSLWADQASVDRARAALSGLGKDLTYVQYRPVRDLRAGV